MSALLEYHFMINALLAGGVVAVMAGLVGWLMVLRREAFAGHTLSMMAFPGATGAALIGISAAWGYFAFCAAGALAIGRLSGGERRSWSEQSASIGAVQASALAANRLTHEEPVGPVPGGDRGGVKLHQLEIGERCAGSQREQQAASDRADRIGGA